MTKKGFIEDLVNGVAVIIAALGKAFDAVPFCGWKISHPISFCGFGRIK
jgi:hypothetical protein